MQILFLLLLLLVLATGTVTFLLLHLRARHDELTQTHEELQQRFDSIADIEAEKQKILATLEEEKTRLQSEIQRADEERTRRVRESVERRQRIELETAELRQKLECETTEQKQQATAELVALQTQIAQSKAELRAQENLADLPAFGYYKPQFDYGTAVRFGEEIERVRDQQKTMLTSKKAAIYSAEWKQGENATEWREHTECILKLMLRAFNGECDAAIAQAVCGNLPAMEARIEKAFETINQLGRAHACEITTYYLALKRKELHLTHEYRERLAAEKEESSLVRDNKRYADPIIQTPEPSAPLTVFSSGTNAKPIERPGGRFIIRMHNGKESFLMTDKELLDLCRSGVLKPHTEIFDTITNQWYKASELFVIPTV